MSVPFDPTDPLSFPSEFKNWLIAYIEANPPVLPIGQIFGFTQFNPQLAARVNTSESTASATYADLATVGPQLTDLADGNYLLFFGCTGSVSAAGVSLGMGVKVNLTEATDAQAVQIPSVSNGQSGIMLAPAALTSRSNTVTCRYRVLSGDSVKTLTAASRWLVAIKYSNL